jgi:hypothetical protein
VADGEEVAADAVVVATDGSTATSLLPQLPAPEWHGVTTWYHTMPELAGDRSLLVLEPGEGPVANSVVLTATAPTYSADGRTLVATSVVGAHRDDPDLGDRIAARVADLHGAMGSDVEEVGCYRIDRATPVLRPPLRLDRPVTVGSGRYVCGVWWDTPSIQGALASGARAARAVLDAGERSAPPRSGVPWHPLRAGVRCSVEGVFELRHGSQRLSATVAIHPPGLSHAPRGRPGTGCPAHSAWIWSSERRSRVGRRKRRKGDRMGFTRRALTIIATTTVAGAALLAAAGTAGADPYGPPHGGWPSGGWSPAIYVAPSGSTAAPGWGSSCQRPSFTAIQPAIEAAPTGGTVVVCAGTYPGMVNVDKQITLSGQPGATINATGDAYGVGVSASGSTVQGLKVTGASPLNPNAGQLADGIVTIALGAQGPVAADNVRIIHNDVSGNLGSGIDLNSTSGSTASFNVADGNGVGINVADDLGRPANGNSVTANTTDDNFGGCGIALADHTGAGVRDTLVAFNSSDDNGLATATAPDATAGSGVILASPVPGGIVSDNRVTLNEFHGNGHGGVVVHAHAPGDTFTGNSVTLNRIGTNNVLGDENDPQTTGIYLGSFSPMSITVSANLIGPDTYGIFTSGPVTVTGWPNLYFGVTNKLGSSPNF